MKIQQLISRCIQKEKAAQKELYYAYAPKLFGICRRYSSDDHQAKDYMQDSFEKIFSKLDHFDVKKGLFDAWISRITVNTIVSDKRKKAVRGEHQDLNILLLERTPIDDTETDDIFKQTNISPTELLEAIRKLPADYQLVLNLAIFEDWKHKEIAKELNIAESSSRSKLTRAKKMLKSLLTSKSIKYHERKVG